MCLKAARITTMQIDRRFADYGLTGGLFLVCQLSLLWALGYWPTVLNELQALRLPPDNSLLAPIITGFAGALAVIAVFVTGLILDLLASFFRNIEMKVFATHLGYNRDWLNDLIEASLLWEGLRNLPARAARAAVPNATRAC